MGEVRGLRRTAAGGGGSSGQSALLPTDKDGYLWVVAQKQLFTLKNTLSNRQDKNIREAMGIWRRGYKEKRKYKERESRGAKC